MLRRIVLTVVLAVLVLGASAGTFWLLASLAESPAPIELTHAPLAVSAVRIEPTTVVAPVQGFGTARADRRAIVSSEVAGRVVWLEAGLRDGAAVDDDAVLVRLDAREYQARLERARSQLTAAEAALRQIDIEKTNLDAMIETTQDELAVAEREFNRIRDLLERGASSVRELDDARVVVQRSRRTLQELQRQRAVIPERREQQKATCDLYRAEIALAELNVERCTISAPFAGRIDDLQVELGEQVSPGRQLLTVLDPRQIEVPIELPVSWRERVQVGADAHLYLESKPDTAWQGTIARIAPSADERTRTFSLFVEVTNPADASRDGPTAGPAPLMPGMFVAADIAGPELRDALLVPRDAIRKNQVFVCEDGRAYARPIKIEYPLPERAAVAGITPGSVLITSNLDTLTDAMPVRPVFAKAAGEASTQPAAAARSAGTEADAARLADEVP